MDEDSTSGPMDEDVDVSQEEETSGVVEDTKKNDEVGSGSELHDGDTELFVQSAAAAQTFLATKLADATYSLLQNRDSGFRSLMLRKISFACSNYKNKPRQKTVISNH